MTVEKQDRIRIRAYAIWEESGRPDGLHEDHWHQAAREIELEDVAPVTLVSETVAQPLSTPIAAKTKTPRAATGVKRTKAAKTV